MDKKLHSYHTFIFPFNIEAKKKGEKVDIKEIIKKIKNDKNWVYEAFDITGSNLLKIYPNGAEKKYRIIMSGNIFINLFKTSFITLIKIKIILKLVIILVMRALK